MSHADWIEFESDDDDTGIALMPYDYESQDEIPSSQPTPTEELPPALQRQDSVGPMKTPKGKGKREGLNAYHCFTINNYTPEQTAKLATLADPESNDTNYPNGIMFAKEVGDQGTPHLQGLIYFKKRIRFTALKIWFKQHLDCFPHLEATIDVKRSQDYIKGGDIFKDACGVVKYKPANKPDDIFLYGEMKVSKPDLASWYKAVKASDVDDIEDIDHPFRLLPGYMMTASNLVSDKINKQNWETQEEYYKNDFVLNAFQRDVMQAIEDLPRRRVLWIADPRGHHGKSELCFYLDAMNKNRTYYVNSGKAADIAYGVQPFHNLLLIDLERATAAEDEKDFTPYKFIEQCANVCIRSNKYVPRTIRLGPDTKTVVMSNHEPDFTKMTEDKFVIMRIDPTKYQ